MEWVKPENSKSQVDKAGSIIISSGNPLSSYLKALGVVNNWRSSHNYPLNTFKVTLRSYAHEVDPNRLVAQRIKRLSSIEDKLSRLKDMQLSRMQDLGGCRAIVNNVNQVKKLVEKYENSDIKHKLEKKNDYIENPKKSGYRSVHLVYKYYSDKKSPSIYNGLRIEIQIRTRLQHAWATAVETVGTLRKEALKSSLGEKKWLRFFQLMGSVIAVRENCKSLVPNTPTDKISLIKELRKLTGELNVEKRLKMYGDILKVGEDAAKKSDAYYLLKLEPAEQRMTVTGFKRRQLKEASETYLKLEREISESPSADVVLVAVDSISSLRKAYPNYFLDTDVFLSVLKDAIKRPKPNKRS